MDKKLELVIYINGTFEEEKALVENTKVLEHGDYYHDKITEKIEGFINGLNYAGYTVNVDTKEIYPSDEIFNIIGFESNE